MAKNKENKASDRIRKQQGNKKRVVTTSQTSKPKLQPTKSRTQDGAATSQSGNDMLFKRENFILLIVGAVLVFIGILLMSGGQQPPNEWNPDEIYSIRRTYLAPVVILLGLIAVLVSIFIKKQEVA